MCGNPGPPPSFPRTREPRDIRTTVYLAPLWLARSACAGAACFALLWVPASAGMTWLSRAVIAVSTVGHCRSHAPPLRVHPLRNSLRSFASPSLREGEDSPPLPPLLAFSEPSPARECSVVVCGGVLLGMVESVVLNRTGCM